MQRFFRMELAVTRLGVELEGRIDRLERVWNERFRSSERQLHELQEQAIAIEDRLDGIEDKLDTILAMQGVGAAS